MGRPVDVVVNCFEVKRQPDFKVCTTSIVYVFIQLIAATPPQVHQYDVRVLSCTIVNLSSHTNVVDCLPSFPGLFFRSETQRQASRHGLPDQDEKSR
jgi:hypothetical protein